MSIPENRLHTSVLNDKLKSFSYYKYKLPVYLRQSEGFIEHFKIWYDLLVGKIKQKYNQSTNEFIEVLNNGLVSSIDILFNLLNIFDDNYLVTIEELAYASFTIDNTFNNYKDYVSDILDKLAALFSLQRSFKVEYTNEDNIVVTKQLTLTNDELLKLIKIQIVKNYCDGSYKQLYDVYTIVGLPLLITTSTEAATSNIYLAVRDNMSITDNIKDLFFAGLLTIQQMGIAYRYTLLDLDKILFWDDNVYTDDYETIYGWGNDANNEGGLLII